MKELGVTFHCGSGKNAIKSEKDLKSIDAHNNRKYKNKNNQELDPEKSHENVVIVGTDNIIEDVKKVYKDEFNEAVYDYNMKQKREDRKILDYYNQINNDKQTNLAVEMIFQLGDYDHWKDKSMDDKKKMVSIYSKAVDILKDKNIITAQATVHMDESSPHLHLIAVPIADNNKRGLSKQVSQNKVLTIKAIKEIREEIEKVFISEYKKTYKEEITLKKGRFELPDHLDVKKYKKAKEILKVAKEYEYNNDIKDTLETELENTKEEIKEIEEKITKAEKEKENKIEKIENVKQETNNLTNELTKLETTKNGKLKEKEDKEIELDLYQKKIKDYKEQIEKDKEEAIKLEEEQKKIEEDLKAQEKKNRDVKDEIDKKNKEYNDLLTERNNQEEKKKKLEDENKKNEEFYKSMEVTIKEEREKMIKDVKDASINLTEEKKKLEDANLELINANTELVNNNNALLKALETEKEKKENIIKEKEKIEKENKEIENSITNLKNEKTNLEANKLEISAGVKTLLENQKNYSDTLQLEYKKLENKKEVEKTADNNVTEIALVVQGDFYREAIYGKDYKSDYIFFNGDNIVERIEGKEKDDLTYTVASAVYSVYAEEMKRTDLRYNTKTGKTDLIIDYVDYETEEKKTDTITFKEMKIDKFFTLVKEKLGELKEAIIESIKQQFNYANNNPKDVFTEEKNKKNIETKNNEREY